MRITNQAPVNSGDSASASPSRADSASGLPSPNFLAQPEPSVSAEAYSLVPSFELSSLNAALQQIPPVRPDQLAETIRQLVSGQLQSPDTLAQTAEAILGD